MCKHQDRKKSYGDEVVKRNNHVAPGTKRPQQLATGKSKASHYQSNKAPLITLAKPQSSSEMELAGGRGWYGCPSQRSDLFTSISSQCTRTSPSYCYASKLLKIAFCHPTERSPGWADPVTGWGRTTRRDVVKTQDQELYRLSMQWKSTIAVGRGTQKYHTALFQNSSYGLPIIPGLSRP